MGELRTTWEWRASSRPLRAGQVVLVRRGAQHGTLTPRRVGPAPLLDFEAEWRAARPIVLRGWLEVGGARASRAIEVSRRRFERLRRGASFSEFLRERLAHVAGARRARVTGSSEDVADPLEIEKVHATLAVPGGQDLFAKLSWIADDERDASLRIRFSFGSERSLDWRGDATSARAADRLAELVFPECALLARHRRLGALLARLAGGRVRLSERIVYNNAPGGGASFHHDAEPGQLGVLYGQLCGATAWLALPRDELAEEVARLARRGALARRAGTPRRARSALERADEPQLARLLNHDARLTRRLAERGAFLVLRRGDALILPSPSRETCAWHSVFALGRRASVAHSYGVFRAR